MKETTQLLDVFFWLQYHSNEIKKKNVSKGKHHSQAGDSISNCEKMVNESKQIAEMKQTIISI